MTQANLTDADLDLLATLAAEQGDNRVVSMVEREEWLCIAERITERCHSQTDLRKAGHLARRDSGYQTDARVALRYLGLAVRAEG